MVCCNKSDGRLLVEGNQITFPVQIKQVIDYEAFVVIRLAVTLDDHQYKYSNVIAVDEDGTILWTLPERPAHDPRPYTKIYTTTGEDLWTNNSSGWLYEADPETGEIVDREFVK